MRSRKTSIVHVGGKSLLGKDGAPPEASGRSDLNTSLSDVDTIERFHGFHKKDEKAREKAKREGTWASYR